MSCHILYSETDDQSMTFVCLVANTNSYCSCVSFSALSPPLLNAVCWAEKQQIQILVFGLTRSGLEPMIYRTRGEHTNTRQIYLKRLINMLNLLFKIRVVGLLKPSCLLSIRDNHSSYNRNNSSTCSRDN